MVHLLAEIYGEICQVHNKNHGTLIIITIIVAATLHEDEVMARRRFSEDVVKKYHGMYV